MKTIKNVPNYITLTRILAAVALIFVPAFSVSFFFFYFVCGISDVLDGYFARRFGLASKFGQALDSVADLIFISSVLTIFLPIINLSFWLILWIAAIALLRILSIIVGYMKYRQLAFLHTLSNKFTGLVLFFFPLLIVLFGKEPTAILLCSIASISAIEELMITVTSTTLQRDIKSIFRQ